MVVGWWDGWLVELVGVGMIGKLVGLVRLVCCVSYVVICSELAHVV